MKRYRIIHIPTGEFFDIDEHIIIDHKGIYDHGTLIENITYIAHRAYPSEKCISVQGGCRGCPWNYVSAEEHTLEYLVEEIK